MRIDHLKAIADYWNTASRQYCLSHPEHRDASMHPSWGIWHIPEANLGLLADELRPGRQLVDLGCGPGHDAVAFAKYGVDVLAVDISMEQINQAIQHPRVKYALAPAEHLPVDNESIDIAVSDHGAFDHSPAELLLIELQRVLKPNAVLVICTYSPLAFVCYNPATSRLEPTLLNAYPSNYMRFDGKLVTCERSYAEWIRAFRKFGFIIERLEELIPPSDSATYFDELLDVGWASRWPSDIVWVVRKSGQTINNGAILK